MTLKMTVASADQLTTDRATDITRFGLPYTLTLSETGEPRAFMRICPHKWIVMNPTKRGPACFICPLEGMAFDVNSGEVRNRAGKRTRRGLRPVKSEFRDGNVVLSLEWAQVAFFIYAKARNAARTVGRVGKWLR